MGETVLGGWWTSLRVAAGSGESPGGSWCSGLDASRLPRHVAFIPDGNRRWARRRGLPPWEGHRRGYQVAREVLNALWGLGVPYVTFYGLSRENCLRRPREELERIHGLLGLAVEELLGDPRVRGGSVRLYFVGDTSLLPAWLREKIAEANEATSSNGPNVVTVGVCYGGRWEVVEAARRLLEKARGGEPTGELLTEEGLRRLMPLGWLPEPDLVIRTGGELRLSGFLLYHAAYSELYFTETLWPDFSPGELCRALHSYQRRERRFGR